LARTSLNFGRDKRGRDELELARAAAVRAGMKLNPWIRRAVCEQADMEAAIAAQEAESRVGLERDGGVDWPLSNEGLAAVNREMLRSVSPKVESSFRPDFGKRLKP
jgi:hypothetical protein